MNLNKDPESWARVKPDAFLSGSIIQARNVLEMALQDIARMQIEMIRIRKERDDAVEQVEEAAIWPTWAESILKKLKSYGCDPVEDDQTVDLAAAFDEWVDDYARECTAHLEKIEYATVKASLTDAERLADIRQIVSKALPAD